MTLSIGERVSLPSHGPCVIGAVVNKQVGGTSTAFDRLAPLEDNGGGIVDSGAQRDHWIGHPAVAQTVGDSQTDSAG